MKKVYIASPYTVGDAGINVRHSMEAYNLILDAGGLPFSPLHSHFQHIYFPRSYEEWLNIDLAWLEICDCVWRLPGESKGADIETGRARFLGLPVFFDLLDVEHFIKK